MISSCSTVVSLFCDLVCACGLCGWGNEDVLEDLNVRESGVGLWVSFE